MKYSKSATMALLCTLAACAVKTEKTADTLAADSTAPITGIADTGVATQTPPPNTDTSAPPPSRVPTPTPPPAGSGTAMTVTENGIGPVHVGMTVAEASKAVGGGFAAPRGYDGGCGYAAWAKAPAGTAVMLEKSKVARVEVRSGSTPTAAGARIGDSEARIKSLYPGRVVTTPHKYTAGGHYLTVTSDHGGSNQIIFETDGKVVTEFRSGAPPAVAYVERCG